MHARAPGGTGGPPVVRRGPRRAHLPRSGSLGARFTIRVRCAKCFRRAAGSNGRAARSTQHARARVFPFPAWPPAKVHDWLWTNRSRAIPSDEPRQNLKRPSIFAFTIVIVALFVLAFWWPRHDGIAITKGGPEIPAPTVAAASGAPWSDAVSPSIKGTALTNASAAGQSATFAAFGEWTARYLAAPEAERARLTDEGLTLASARRAELRQIIAQDPRRAIENAVPPVVRQQLPLAVVRRLEERVNETAFFGVMGALPSAESTAIPPYRREVRTGDGGQYRAFVYGGRLNQRTTENASIVGIAVDDLLAVDERPLRTVASGEIPNHPNNLTRERTLSRTDAQGFSLGRQITTAPAPPRDTVETCPISGQSTVAPKAADGSFAPVSSEQVVVEAGGQFHFLCSGGHIHAFEEDLIAREGGNGGPMQPTSPPAATQSTGYKSHLLMRVAFPEALKGSVTEKEGYDLGKNVQDWFLDTSYGAMTFATTVTPLLILPRTEAWYKDQDTGSAFEVLTDARAAAKAAGFDPGPFNFDTVIYTGTPGGFSGQAYVGGKGCWLKSGTGTGVACHEYGHNFGLWHANFWSTTNGSVIGGGTHVEYGDSFDTMGSASAGDYQFNACHKNLLNWIPTALVHDATAGGTYRIYQMDQPRQDPRLRYALKIRKDSDRDYWVDFRQRFPTNTWVQGGVFLHWSAWLPSAGGSHLLDTTPGSPDGKNDAPISIGRTFSDLESGIHITPIAKNTTTSPTSVDVVVNLGTFAGNSAPVVSIGASATSVAISTNVTFTATATDADGDVLSYAWDFGDKSFSTTNAPVATKSWAVAGDYRVRCTASDMKGGTASASVIVTVGSPGTFRLAGTITAGGLPLKDVRVHNGLSGASYHDAYTDSDGTYVITGLTAATYAVGTQIYGYTLAPATASVTVGPDASGVIFTASTLATVSIAVQDGDCSEGANTGSFRIARTGSPAAALTVQLYYPSGSAAKGSDYTLTPDVVSVSPYYTLTIPTGQPFLDVVVTAIDDANVESFERVTLELAPSANYVLGNPSATIWIADNDTVDPLVRLRVTKRDAAEGGDSGQFLLERIGPTVNALNVTVAITGTATAGADYVAIPTTVTIPAGASTALVNVTPLQDTIIETVETVVLTISTSANYVRAASSADYSGTVNLYDDDAPVVTVVATDSAASEAGNDPGVFTITRSGATTNALTVNYGLTGSALHGTDYVALPGVLTIPAGSAVGTVVITPIEDSIGEPSQTVVLEIRGGLGYSIGAASSATVTITDNSDVTYASIAVTAGPAVEGGAAGTFRVTTTGTGTGNIDVKYTVSGTATNGTDYTALSGTLTMAKNTTANITITPIQDAIVEGYETIIITLNPDPAYSLALDASATMNLQDDDAPVVNVSGTDDVFTETTGSLAKFWISRTGATTAALTVNYTLGGTATAGLDYTAPSGTVTIAAGAVGAYVDVSMLDDTLAEGTETIILNITPDPAYGIGFGSVTRYIIDAESASVATQVRFSASTSTAVESAGTVNIPVTLSAASAETVTVEYVINGGTALAAGIDYSLTPGLLTFDPGITTQNIPVIINDDTLDEANETVILLLINPANARLGTSSHTLTITDNDAPPGVTVGFAGTTGSGLESQSPAPLAVALSTAQAAAVTVDYAVTGGTATNGTDFAITNGTLTFAIGETVKVIPNTITNDLTVESNETIILTLSNPTGAALSPNTVFTYTITDDDAATVTIAATDATASEPGTDTGTFTITRTGSTTAALTVNLAFTGTATSGADYVNISNTALIPAGSASVAVPVVVVDDTIPEPTETVVATLMPGIYTIGAPASATVNIVDDEPIVSILASIPNAAEPATPGAFTVSRTGTTTKALTVPLVVSGTATAGADYAALPATVLMPAGTASVTVPLTPLSDTLAEGNESVIVTLASGSDYTLGAPATATVTIADAPNQAWRLAKFGANANNAAIAGDFADPDRDGLKNIFEYGFNTNPLGWNAGPTVTKDGSDYIVTYRRNVAATDLTFEVLAGSDLSSWSAVGTTDQILSDDGSTQVIAARVSSYPAGPKSFFRMRVQYSTP